MVQTGGWESLVTRRPHVVWAHAPHDEVSSRKARLGVRADAAPSPSARRLFPSPVAIARGPWSYAARHPCNPDMSHLGSRSPRFPAGLPASHGPSSGFGEPGWISTLGRADTPRKSGKITAGDGLIQSRSRQFRPGDPACAYPGDLLSVPSQRPRLGTGLRGSYTLGGSYGHSDWSHGTPHAP